MKKKYNSLLIVRKSSSEIDWIIPVIERMKSNVNFYTFFLNEKAFESLRSSKFLYEKWKKLSKSHYIQKRTDKIFYKILRIFLNKFSTTLNNNIHNVDYLKSKLNFDKSKKLHFILNEFQKTSYWVDVLKKEDKKTKLFLYPHTTHIYKYDKAILNKIKKKNKKKICDAIFLGSPLDKDIWANRIDDNKIHITGHPKYDKIWQSQFSKKEREKKNNLVFAVKNITDTSSYKITKKYLEVLYKICSKNKYFLTVKIPPYPQEKLNKIIYDFKKEKKSKKFEISNENIFSCLNNCKLLVNFNLSATSLDALSNKVPVIQLPAISKLKKKFGNNNSIYTSLKLVSKASGSKELAKKIKEIIENKNYFKNNILKNYIKYFPKKQNASKKISNIILDMIR